MTGTSILITGATSGIGRAFAKNLAGKAARLILVSRNKDKLESCKQELGSEKCTITVVSADLSKPGSAEYVYDTCRKEGIEIDTLINNAGSGYFGESTDLDHEKVRESVYLNSIAVTELSMLFAKDMKQRGSGSILNIASTGAYQPVPYMAAYAASKSYVLNFSEALAMELEDYGVTVTCLSPGMTDTDWFEKAGIAPTKKGFFSTTKRIKPEIVAEYGITILEKGRLSSIHGVVNGLMAFLNRLLPRKMIAKISKKMVKTGLPSSS